MDKLERVARAICAEKCAFMGEPPCYTVEGEWPNPNCQEPGCHAEAQAAIAALEPMDKPRVKPLVWRVDDNRTAYAQSQYFADRYCIEHRLHGDDAFDLWIGPDAVKATRHATIEAAKAAAQADYEAGILAAIEPAPVSVREAARVLLDECKDGEVWPMYVNAMMPVLNADLSADSWNTVDEIRAAFAAALRAIAEGKDDE